MTDWNATAIQATQTIGFPPPLEGYFITIASVCVYDAVNSIIGDYTPYLVDEATPAAASAEAAAAAAAHFCLINMLPPPVAPLLDDAYAASLAAIPDGQSKTDGIDVGESVGSQVLAARAGDGPFLAAVYPVQSPPVAPGVWVPTPADNGEFPPFLPPLFGGLALLQPFTMDTQSQFRPKDPPVLTSAHYTQDLNEVQSVGSFNSVTRTPDQTNSAIWWNASGILIWNAVGRELSARHQFTLSQNARLFAMLNMAAFDGNNATFDAKYAFWFWRPVTAIRQADTDGNPNTTADPNWRPLLDTPPFPEYTSGHAGFTGAASTVLEHFFPSNNGFSMTTPTSPNQARTFSHIAEARNELENARVWGGIHFRTADVKGIKQGRQIARHAIHNVLRKVHRQNVPHCDMFDDDEPQQD